MSTSVSFSDLSKDLPQDFRQLAEQARDSAKEREGDCIALLELLRLLESLHFEIRDTLFRDALPDNRQRLYRLLKDIEQEGGWPYIKRMQLLALIEHIEEEDDEENRREIAEETL